MQLTLMVTGFRAFTRADKDGCVYTFMEYVGVLFKVGWFDEIRMFRLYGVGLTFMNIFMRAYRGNSNHYRGRISSLPLPLPSSVFPPASTSTSVPGSLLTAPPLCTLCG